MPLFSPLSSRSSPFLPCVSLCPTGPLAPFLILSFARSHSCRMQIFLVVPLQRGILLNQVSHFFLHLSCFLIKELHHSWRLGGSFSFFFVLPSSITPQASQCFRPCRHHFGYIYIYIYIDKHSYKQCQTVDIVSGMMTWEIMSSKR